MNINERVSYIRGLAEGLVLDNTTKEGKILSAMIELLSDIADEVSAIDEACAELGEQLDAVDEDLSALEDVIYEDDEYDDCCDCDCDCDLDDDELYEVTCPNCNDTIYLDADMLDEGGIDCPNCGTDLEFDFDCECEDCDCDECDVD